MQFLKLGPKHGSRAAVPLVPAFRELESIDPMDLHASEGVTAQAQAVQRHGFIQELHAQVLAGPRTCGSGDLPRAHAVQPEPDDQRENEQCYEMSHLLRGLMVLRVVEARQ